MDKVFVVKRVAERLWSTEDAIDAAMAENAKLMNELIDARRELKVPHQLTDAATSKIAEAMDLMARARHAMIESHDALYEAKLRLGVRMETPSNHPIFVQHEDTVTARRSKRRAG